MQAFVARRGAFVAAILTISGIAATSGHAAADDAGVDAGVDDAGQQPDVSQDAPAIEASTPDATVADAGTAPEAAVGDEFDLYSLDGAGPVQDDGSLPVYMGSEPIYQELCVADPTVADPTTKPFSFTSVKAPYTTMADCVNYNDEGHHAAHTCLCNKCFTLMQECDSLEGCREILKCGQDHACTDPTTCYFASCTTVTDKWANTSIASFLSAKLDGCGCPSQ
jgi:hypothetical protein